LNIVTKNAGSWGAGANAGDIIFSPNEVDVMTIQKGGNVGIGTTSPQGNLDVVGIARTTGAAGSGGGNVHLRTSEISVVDGDDLGTLSFLGLEDGTYTNKIGAMIRAEASGAWGGETEYDGETELQFFTQSNGAADALATPRMLIDATGNVGIGTTTPQNTLNVVGAINATSGYTTQSGTGVTDSSSYWLCTADDCSSTCQVEIDGGIIVGCT